MNAKFALFAHLSLDSRRPKLAPESILIMTTRANEQARRR
jgi:hypothetical protein